MIPPASRGAVMVPLIESPTWLLILIAVVIFVAIASSKRRRLLDRQRFEVRVCRHCGASQPGHAAFCRTCGRRLED